MSQNNIRDIYRPSLALLTDLYQITMAYAYWKTGGHDKQAMFQMFFRRLPFGGGFAVAAGLEALINYVDGFVWGREDLEFIAAIKGSDGRPIVCDDFIHYLKTTPFRVSIDAVEEGCLVFPHEPLIRVTGPLLQCQLLETALLNLINFPTLIATKAARICLAAQGDKVLEFGLRRAQGVDGGLTASRSAFIGGVDGTSNLLAGSLYGIPVGGTHAHSWVMSFDNELEAFMKFASSVPGSSIFLVDTYNTIAGVKNAIKAGRWLRENGHELYGVRLDSGDLGYLSKQARTLLDEAGFDKTVIVGSNDLDESQIVNLKSAGAKISVWGVGTRLVTGYDDPALGGVYKLVAIRDSSAESWRYKLKLSDQISKITTPGRQQIRRFTLNGEYAADMVFDELSPPGYEDWTIVDPTDMTRRKKISKDTPYEDLLRPVIVEGKRVYDGGGVHAARQRCREQLTRLNESIKRIANPHDYPAGLDVSLHERKAKMILDLKGF
jgi:nicotinate phosphoribosyltransferase